MKQVGCALIILWTLVAHAGAHSAGLMVVTEPSAPLQYEVQGELRGIAVDIVRETLQRSGVPWRMYMMPWARAYKMATTRPDVLIFSISRTAQREPLFHWVGPIVPIEYGLYALKKREDIRVETLADAKQYLIGVTNQDVRHQYLLSKGFREGDTQGLFPVSDQVLNYRMLFAGRIDLIAMGSMTCLTGKIDCSKLRKVYPLTDISRGLYMAFSKGTREDWRKRVEAAFESLRAGGTLEKLQAPLRQ